MTAFPCLPAVLDAPATAIDAGLNKASNVACIFVTARVFGAAKAGLHGEVSTHQVLSDSLPTRTAPLAYSLRRASGARICALTAGPSRIWAFHSSAFAITFSLSP